MTLGPPSLKTTQVYPPLFAAELEKLQFIKSYVDGDFNERLTRRLCVDDDDETEVPKEKLDFIPKMSLCHHLLDQ